MKPHLSLKARMGGRVLLKATILFVIFNLLFGLLSDETLGKPTLYNRLVPGRERFPFGENAAKSYNLSVTNLEAMFASLHLDGEVKPVDEFRVLVVGDSSVWGSLVRPEDTLAGQLDRMGLISCDGRAVKFYNLGYPTLSVLKDVMIIDRARRYQPNLVIWLTTLEAFPLKTQLETPLVAANPQTTNRLIEAYHLPFDLQGARGGLSWTIPARRREVADLIRLQMYGFLWAATGIDQDYPSEYTPAKRDFGADDRGFHDFQVGKLPADQMAYALIDTGMQTAGAPVLLVNEPILISSGENSQIRYNYYYPRWAYDAYRTQLAALAEAKSWTYVDDWNLVAENQFTNSAIHMTPQGIGLLATHLAVEITREICR